MLIDSHAQFKGCQVHFMIDPDRGNHSWDKYLTITVGWSTAPRPSSCHNDIFEPIDQLCIKHGLPMKAAITGFERKIHSSIWLNGKIYYLQLKTNNNNKKKLQLHSKSPLHIIAQAFFTYLADWCFDDPSNCDSWALSTAVREDAQVSLKQIATHAPLIRWAS